MENIDLIGFFTFGLTIGFGHCIGMCHPFVLYISGRFVGEKKGYTNLFVPHLFYNIGRTVTYSILGAVAGFIGDVAELAGNLAGVQKISAIVAGGFLIIYGFFYLGGFNILNKLESEKLSGAVRGILNKIQPKTAFGTGLILGLLPCGPLYGAFIGVTSTASAAKGALYMAVFGIGTMAAMMLAAVFGNLIMGRRGLFSKAAAILLIAMGAYFIYMAFKF